MGSVSEDLIDGFFTANSERQTHSVPASNEGAVQLNLAIVTRRGNCTNSLIKHDDRSGSDSSSLSHISVTIV